MLQYKKGYQLKIIISIDDTFSEQELKELAEAVAIYKESPKSTGFKSIVRAFVSSAKLSRRFVSEQNITKLRRIMKNAPSRPITMILRRQGLLEGTYEKEVGRGKHGYIVYYDVEKIIKRFAQLDQTGYMKSIALHKIGKMDWIFAKQDAYMKDKREIETDQRKRNSK